MTRIDYDPTDVDRRPPVAAILGGCLGFAVFVLGTVTVALVMGGAL